MPPTKLKPSAASFDRKTGKTTITHYYIKTISKDELFKELNNHNTKPKIKQKILNELVRRGIKIVWRPKEDG
jgi:hypothetical protein|tara:strand:- start:2961 stop:3176 length:216 start_codon:yes stop_codon:yes gene_type:complete